jgi:hypothetical protein
MPAGLGVGVGAAETIELQGWRFEFRLGWPATMVQGGIYGPDVNIHRAP